MVTFGNAQIHYQKIPVLYQTRPWKIASEAMMYFFILSEDHISRTTANYESLKVLLKSPNQRA